MRTTNKILLFFFIITSLSFMLFAVSGFRDLSEKIKNKPNTEFKNIRCIEVDGRVAVNIIGAEYVNNYEQIYWDGVKESNLIVEQKHDTLRLAVKKEIEKEKIRSYISINMRIDKIESIVASSHAIIRCHNTGSKCLYVKLDGSANVYYDAKCVVGELQAAISGHGHLFLDSCSIAKVDMKGSSSFILSYLKDKISGTLNNKSYIDLNGMNYSTKELVKKDSSAVIYRFTNPKEGDMLFLPYY